MNKTKILTRREIEALLSPSVAVAAVEEAFTAHANQAATMPAKVYLDLPEFEGDFRAMPAHLHGGQAGIKWVNSHGKSPERHGVPAVMATFVLSDPETGIPLAVMDATYITAARTGAAAAVASKHLARKDARTIGFIGCGVQAHTMLAAHREVLDGLEVVAADKNDEAAAAFARTVGGRVGSVEDAAGCDVVCTSTPVRQPVVRDSWIRNGAHINAMGADALGKQELESSLLTRAKVFVDEWEQASHSGEINVPLHDGLFSQDQLAGTLGGVIVGRAAGRQNADEITLFDSTGLALQDLACAQYVYDAAKKGNVGVDVDLVGLA